MALASKTRNTIEGLVREGSFKWLLGNRTSFTEDFDEMGKSPSAGRNWIQDLSPIANIVVCRCSKTLEISTSDLQESFNEVASTYLKDPSCYARNFLEYCCFRSLSLSIQVMGHLTSKKFQRLTYDMMLAWEAPAASSRPLLSVDEDASVGLEAFSRIAPAVPTIANVIISENLFEVLTKSTGGRLQFSTYAKYLSGLERAIRKMRTQSESSLLSSFRSSRGEKILEIDGTLTTQPVLEHIGISAWPGRLILTDSALYFEPLRVVSYEKAKRYDLADDLKQVVKPDLTGPWGTRLFDKAVSYKSISLSEPVVMEFPELKGHIRRDYWLAIIREILYAHRFINKFQITGVERNEALLKAILGILRVQAIQEINSSSPLNCEALLMFSLCDQLPGGDLILETLANMSTWRELDTANNRSERGKMYSVSAVAMASNLGFVFGTSSNNSNEAKIVVGEIVVGEMTSLETAVKDSKTNYKKVAIAQATIDGVKVDGIETNLAVMKELIFPITKLGKSLVPLAYWDDPMKSFVFCLVLTGIILRGWLGYAFAFVFILMASFLVLTRFCIQEKGLDEVKVIVPPAMSTMEQLLAVQNAISHFETLLQEGNIFLLKLRALVMSISPQASERCAISLLLVALFLAFTPFKYIVLTVFLNTFTMYSPWRKASTEKWTRRLREWWFSIPAAPVVLERVTDEKKKK